MKSFFLLLPLLIPGIAAAQENAQPSQVKPSPPFVSPLPTNIEFVKTFTYPAARRDRTPAQIAAQKLMDGPQQMQSMDTVKVGDVSKALCTFTNGGSIERWVWKTYVIEADPAPSAHVLVLPITDMDTLTQDKMPTFAEVSWVGLASYSGEQTRQGHRYFTYKQGDRSAWIDEDTKLPAFYASPQFSIAYTYKETPVGPLELPEKMRKQLAVTQNAARGGPIP